MTFLIAYPATAPNRNSSPAEKSPRNRHAQQITVMQMVKAVTVEMVQILIVDMVETEEVAWMVEMARTIHPSLQHNLHLHLHLRFEAW